MDLISREEAINALDVTINITVEGKDLTEYEKEIHELGKGIYTAQKSAMDSIPSAFEGMTYGEVLQAVFGIKDEQIVEAKYLISIYPKGNHHDPFMAVKREVWNSPYKEISVIFGTVGVSE